MLGGFERDAGRQASRAAERGKYSRCGEIGYFTGKGGRLITAQKKPRLKGGECVKKHIGQPVTIGKSRV